MKLPLPLLCLAYCQFLSFGGLRAQCDPVQDSLALVALYNATDGPNWTDNTNWLVPGQPISTWYGIQVNGDGCVTCIDLDGDPNCDSPGVEPGNNLAGSIPPEIGNLANLTQLWLGNNQLTGSIPPETGNLDNLTILSLGTNQLSGNIPSEIGNLDNLTQLYLFNNQLSGSIPSEIGNLDNLTSLRLDNNQLIGSIPSEIGNLSNLVALFIGSNQLEGTIPSSFGNLGNLWQIWLNSNQLTGSIPSEIGSLSSLTWLYLNGNQLTGAIPPELGNLSNLTRFYLQNNQLEGCIPDELSGFCSLGFSTSGNVDGYNLTNNPALSWGGDFTRFCDGEDQIGATCDDGDPDTFDDSIQADCTCRGINVCVQNDSLALVAFYNATNGPNWTDNTNWLVPGQPISTWYGIQVNGDGCVTCIDLDGNFDCHPENLGAGINLVGNIPPDLGNLTKLSTLNLHGNQLTGTIPLELGNLVNLTNLRLGNNQLIGSIPPELGNLVNLTDLRLTSNNITGSIPLELGNLVNLTNLNLSNNQLTGSIPPELGNVTNLNYLRLRSNQLTGSIPPTLGNLTNLISLTLENNQLSGNIPSELGNLLNLATFKADNNQLSGDIPPELSNLFNLFDLWLNNNQFIGSIPSELGNLTSLIRLRLNSNQLSGNIPPEIGNLTNLQQLRLETNQLSGSLPPEIGNLTNLRQLWLNNNQLSDNTPPEIGNLTNLQQLWLNNNQLSGSIPPEIGNLTNLQQLRLNINQLSGSIPQTLGNLPNLIVLFLGNNELTGCFPVSLMNHCDITTSFNFNPQLPWEGDFDRFCDGEDQIGATCDDGDPDTYNDVINPDCSCAGMPLNCDPVQDSLALADLYNTTDGPNWTNTWDLSQPMSTWYGIAVNAKGCVSCIDLDGEPDCIGNTAPSAGNNLSGSLPVTLGNMSALEQLLLGSNNLSGSIPPSLSLAMKLKELNLSYNALSGTLPPDIGDLCELETLNLSNNNLSGSLPAELANLYNIMSINLGENDFTGSFPVEYQVFCSIEAFESEGNGVPDFQAFCAEGEGSDFCPIGIDSLLCTDEWQAYLAAHACGGLCEDSLSTIVHTEVGTVAIKGLDFGYTWTICAAPGGAFQSTTQLWSCRSINIQTCVTGTDSSYCIRHFPIDTLSYVSAWDCSLPLPNCEPSSSTAESSTARVRIYPNPATDMLYVLHDGHQALREISLYSMVGQQVYHHAPSLATAHSYSIPISDLPPGLYALDLQIGDARVVRKVVVGR